MRQTFLTGSAGYPSPDLTRSEDCDKSWVAYMQFPGIQGELQGRVWEVLPSADRKNGKIMNFCKIIGVRKF